MYLNEIKGALVDTGGLNKPDFVPSDWGSCSCDKKCIKIDHDRSEAATGAERQKRGSEEAANQAEDATEEEDEEEEL